MKTLLIIVLLAALAYALDYPQALHALKAVALGLAWVLNTIAEVIYHALA